MYFIGILDALYRCAFDALSMRYQCAINVLSIHFVGTLFDVLHRFAADTFAKKTLVLSFLHKI